MGRVGLTWPCYVSRYRQKPSRMVIDNVGCAHPNEGAQRPFRGDHHAACHQTVANPFLDADDIDKQREDVKAVYVAKNWQMHRKRS